MLLEQAQFHPMSSNSNYLHTKVQQYPRVRSYPWVQELLLHPKSTTNHCHKGKGPAALFADFHLKFPWEGQTFDPNRLTTTHTAHLHDCPYHPSAAVCYQLAAPSHS